jgi:predicted metal-binding membrane protein
VTNETARAPDLLRRLTAPVAVMVAVAVAVAWYVTWSSTELMMGLMMPGMTAADPISLTVFLVLLIVMMVAMMLPSALPMILAYRGLTRLEGGQPVRPADGVATALFVVPYFLVWGAFSVLALLGLMALGLIGPFTGALAFAPAVVFVAAGAYQFTRPKEVCLSHCESPMGFVMHHWRSGRTGALRMGARHALYCIGCCWMFMLVLFVVGAMSLAWMGIVSIFIFAEKVGAERFPVKRVIGILLFVLGGIFALRAALPG